MRREYPGETAVCVIAVGIAAVLCCFLSEVSEGSAGGRYTLVGTCVTRDQEVMPIPEVHILLHPDSTRAISDEAGDFILEWSGRPGWIIFILHGGGPTGEDWCIRRTLQSPSADQGELFVDIGRIHITPGRRVFSTRPELPHGVSPAQITPVAGPAEGDSLEGIVRFRLTTDIHGNVVDAGVLDSETPPDLVAEAVEEWIRSFPWRVGVQTMCDDDHPFNGNIRVRYAWKDGAWHFEHAADRPDRRLRHGRPDSGDQ